MEVAVSVEESLVSVNDYANDSADNAEFMAETGRNLRGFKPVREHNNKIRRKKKLLKLSPI